MQNLQLIAIVKSVADNRSLASTANCHLLSTADRAYFINGNISGVYWNCTDNRLFINGHI